MARIFVMEPRLADALDVIESVIGEEPATLHGHDWPGWIRHPNALSDGESPSVGNSPEIPPAGDQ